MCYLPVANVGVSFDEREGKSNDVSSSIHILGGPHVLECKKKQKNPTKHAQYVSWTLTFHIMLTHVPGHL